MSAPPWQVLEHTADIGLRAYGESLEQLFANAALGLQSIALDPDRVEPRNQYEISANGEDLESLLVNWLNEIVYLLDGAHVALSRIEVSSMADTVIHANAWGEPRDYERHPPRLVVKAATYHQLTVKQQNGWVAEVYFDV